MLGRLRVGGRIILKWFLNKLDVMVWTVVTWVRLGASGGLLWTRNLGVVKRRKLLE
jgi:hypothetical protein